MKCKGRTEGNTVLFYPDPPLGLTYPAPMTDGSQLRPLVGIILRYSELPCPRLCSFPREACSQRLNDKDLVCETEVQEGLRSKNSFLCSPYSLPLVMTNANLMMQLD